MALFFSAGENQNLPAYGFYRSYKLGICSVADLGCCISLNSNWDKQKKKKEKVFAPVAEVTDACLVWMVF